MIVTPEQLRELTGKRYSDAQRRQLDYMRIPYRVRKDGSPVVLLSDLEPQARMQREPELMP